MAAGTPAPPPAGGRSSRLVAAGADRSPSALTLRDVVKTYDDVVAVDAVSLDVRAGEFVTLLGPSGCGKTTTLRMIAGFVEPDSGEIRIGAAEVTRLPPNKRDIGMVFQSYGLFPHLTVEDNVAYGLRMRRVPAAERRRRVEEALGLVQLPASRGAIPDSSAAGSSSAWPWPGRSSSDRRSSCSTSPCRTSTPSSGRRCAGSSGGSSASSTSPRCS